MTLVPNSQEFLRLCPVVFSPSTPPPLAAVHWILPGSTRHSYIVDYRRKHLDQGTQRVQWKLDHLSRLDLCKDKFYQGAATCCQTQARMQDFPSQQGAMRLTCSFNHQYCLTEHHEEDYSYVSGQSMYVVTYTCACADQL